MLVTALLLALLAIATVTDVRGHRIYNWTTYPGILAGVGLNVLGSVLVETGLVEPARLASLGWIGWAPSLVGLALCGFVLLVCFVFLQVGGGDVKLMAMLGAMMGPDQGIEAMLWTFVLGACLALSVLVWRVGPWRLTVRVLRQVLYTLRLWRWSPLTEDERAQLQPPLFLAPCALAAVIIVRFGLITA
ncbi:MAG: prepilin peptidase [Pirellulales bacterium]|nr:prepilin peptidase [Pirellulales bacterium]